MFYQKVILKENSAHMTIEDSPVVANRRSQLQRWIDIHHGGSQKSLIAHTNDGKRQLNQGELSGLLKNKSFGEKKARALETQAGMPAGYLDQQSTQPNPFALAETNETVVTVTPMLRSWPFPSVSLERLMQLKKGLGSRKGVDALHDIDKHLEIVVLKWEKALNDQRNPGKSTAA